MTKTRFSCDLDVWLSFSLNSRCQPEMLTHLKKKQLEPRDLCTVELLINSNEADQFQALISRMKSGCDRPRSCNLKVLHVWLKWKETLNVLQFSQQPFIWSTLRTWSANVIKYAHICSPGTRWTRNHLKQNPVPEPDPDPEEEGLSMFRSCEQHKPSNLHWGRDLKTVWRDRTWVFGLLDELNLYRCSGRCCRRPISDESCSDLSFDNYSTPGFWFINKNGHVCCLKRLQSSLCQSNIQVSFRKPKYSDGWSLNKISCLLLTDSNSDFLFHTIYLFYSGAFSYSISTDSPLCFSLECFFVILTSAEPRVVCLGFFVTVCAQHTWQDGLIQVHLQKTEQKLQILWINSNQHAESDKTSKHSYFFIKKHEKGKKTNRKSEQSGGTDNSK